MPKNTPSLLDRLAKGLLVWDGAMGTQIHNLDLDLDTDYQGCENCTDILSLTRPDAIADIHRAYLAAGADVVTTNSFGAAAHVLGEFDRADDAEQVAHDAAKCAREAADEFSTPDHPRFVAGSLGPGTKLITLGNIEFEPLRDSYAIAAKGLIRGGADAILLETCQDPLQIKAAIQAINQAHDELELERGTIPTLVSVTIEQTGTMLVGASIDAVIETLRPYPIATLGLNCATGPSEMLTHVRTLATKWDRPITLMPNAGLPVLEDGKTVYPLGPEAFAKAIKPFLDEGLVDAIGGCCGTTPEHIAQLRALADATDKQPAPKKEIVPACSSLYSAVEYRQDQSFLIIGERCNASGSRKFKRLLEEEDWDGIVSLAREQVKDRSHVLDVNVDVAGRDGQRDMREVVTRLIKQVDAPLMLDSTNPKVIRAGLECAGGKCIINSANFEDGDEKFDELCTLARDFGAALVIGTIDEDQEQAMARTADRKVSITTRAVERATSKHGLKVSDLFIDPLVLPISTGMDSDRRSASELVAGTRRISEKYPDIQLTCGLSNASFGLNPAARVVINAVLLHEQVQNGMTSAIVHASKITPLHKIPDDQTKAALALIYDKRAQTNGGTGLPEGVTDESFDPLSHVIDLFEDAKEQTNEREIKNLTLEERLQTHIIDGEREGLEECINEALEKYEPLEIINDHLLAGMKVVGELFGSGQMQLPFVLQSAEVMKKAVALLEPHMEKDTSQSKGSIVLATVKGDVHDIGKNLVDILLTNNGYTVHNLGIKQPIDAILAAYEKTKANAIGLSGLLVKSVNVMEENLKEMTEKGLKVPVILGGAALTRTYAEGYLSSVYGSELYYAKDAFEGLDTMNAIVAGKGPELLNAARERQEARAKTLEQHANKPNAAEALPSQQATATLVRSEVARDTELPTPPFWGTKVVKDVALKDIFAYINPTALYSVQWQLKRGKQSKEEHERVINDVAKPKFRELTQRCLQEPILDPKVVYGYFPCASDQDALVVYDPDDHDRELTRFPFPRQDKGKRLCIADFYRDVDECRTLGRKDVLPMMCVTMGETISNFTRTLFENNEYQDYLYWHGIGVESAEALAELWHKRIRQELGFGHEDAPTIPDLFKQGYRGSRYSFGYPACPDMSLHEPMWELLDPTRIGCELTENYQIDPEQSTCAIITHHPEARYFNA
jgi:5-methyltetrahydrofolate--homocysteine methyltransferase